MKRLPLTGLALTALVIALPGSAQTREEEIQAIEAVIQRAYIGGAFNDERDTQAMAEGFHESFTSQRFVHGEFRIQSLQPWRAELDAWKKNRSNWNNRTSAGITVLALEGNAAVARVEVSINQNPFIIDFMSLYKFEEGWKIVHLTSHFPPISYSTHRVSIETWERGVNERQPPDRVLDAVGLKPGMVVGEIGAGRGRYTVQLAARVGNKGKVLANDIDSASLAFLEERCRSEEIGNVETIRGEVNDPRFPGDSLDMAIMVWVYHMLDHPDGLLKSLRPSLKPGAPLVILDPHDSEIDAEFGIDRSQPDVRVPTIKERIERSAAAAGFELVRVETFLPKDYIFILRAKGK